MAISIFKKTGSSGDEGGGEPSHNPEKAKKFFDHARTVQDTENYEYAMQLWLSGMRWDIQSLAPLEAFFHCSANFLNSPASRKGIGKDVVKSVSGAGEVDKYLRSLLEWSLKPTEAALAVRAMEGAAKLRANDQGGWIGRVAFARANAEKNSRRAKELLIKVSEHFGALGQYEASVQSAEAALRHDPSDGELAAHIRSLAATATMNKGGYDKPGQEGGFRQNIRDAAKQRELDDADRISKTEETVERLVTAAETEYIKRPNDLPTVETLGKRLLERGKPSDEERAHQLYMAAYTGSNAFRFRQMAGDIRIRQMRRKVADLEKMLAGAPEGQKEMVQRLIDHQLEDLNALEMDEFRLRVENYPTDLSMKFELGKRYFTAGKFDDSIPLFQEAQTDAKIRPQVLNALGQAFHRIHYYDEAVQTFKGVIEGRDLAPELSREVRYNLMLALTEQGKSHKDANALREADKLASGIATEQFNYRDIRVRRDEIKKLLAAMA
ncbi:MAG: hypothetical protein U0637_13070 [Phycisphaerales bacterium]